MKDEFGKVIGFAPTITTEILSSEELLNKPIAVLGRDEKGIGKLLEELFQDAYL